MLKMKKATRQEKRYLAKHAVNRQTISRESKYDREKRERLQKSIQKTKRMKLEGSDENIVHNTSSLPSNSAEESEKDEPIKIPREQPKKKMVKSGKLGFKTAALATKTNPKKTLKKKKNKVKSAEKTDI
jgi:hypothetical protein